MNNFKDGLKQTTIDVVLGVSSASTFERPIERPLSTEAAPSALIRAARDAVLEQGDVLVDGWVLRLVPEGEAAQQAVVDKPSLESGAESVPPLPPRSAPGDCVLLVTTDAYYIVDVDAAGDVGAATRVPLYSVRAVHVITPSSASSSTSIASPSDVVLEAPSRDLSDGPRADATLRIEQEMSAVMSPGGVAADESLETLAVLRHSFGGDVAVLSRIQAAIMYYMKAA